MTETNKPKGRPPKPLEQIPDTFQNIVKAQVKPVNQEGSDEH